MTTHTIIFRANKQDLRVINGFSRFASDTINYIYARFEFDDDWKSFDVVKAVWKNDIAKIAQIVTNETDVAVPIEMLSRRSEVFVNLVGYSVVEEELTERLTTYPVPALIVDKTAIVEGSESDGVSPSLFEQYIEVVSDEVNKVLDMTVSAHASETPTVTKTVGSVVNLSFGLVKGDKGDTGPAGSTGPQGPTGPSGSDGADGQDGFSPIATVSKEDDTATITITDKNGTTTTTITDGADGQDGADGSDGADGFSPTATVTKSGKVATITITDKNGTTTATVSDGEGEDNVQSDWNVTDNTSDAYIKNKPTLATVATSGDYTDLTNKPTIPTVPTNVSSFTNDAGYLTLSTLPTYNGGVS